MGLGNGHQPPCGQLGIVVRGHLFSDERASSHCDRGMDLLVAVVAVVKRKANGVVRVIVEIVISVVVIGG